MTKQPSQSGISIRLDSEGKNFVVKPSSSEDFAQSSSEYSCPISFFNGRDCKYRSEVVCEILSYVGLNRTSTVFMSETAVEKIDMICDTARLLF